MPGFGPAPDTFNPRLPTVARSPGVMSVRWPVAKAVTSTCPRETATEPSRRPTVTVKCVPLTTAARVGVSTEKCCTFRRSTSNCTDPAFSSTVVDSPSSGRSLSATMLLGPTIIDSVPRTSITRDAWAVESVCAGGRAIPVVSSTRPASVVSQAWPVMRATRHESGRFGCAARPTGERSRPDHTKERGRFHCGSMADELFRISCSAGQAISKIRLHLRAINKGQ